MSGGRERMRMRPTDLVRTAWLGVSSRPQRTALAALGVALGIAALTALTGVAASNQAALLSTLDRMGANLAVVSPGVGPDNEPVPLPDTAPAMVRRLGGVERVGVLETVPEGLKVYRNDLIPAGETNGLTVAVARPGLLGAIDGTLRSGRWFDDASRSLPAVVLGAVAAERLGIDEPASRVWIDGRWYGVIGILESAGLASDIDTAAILGDRWVRDAYAGTADIGTIAALYVRAAPGRVDAVRDLLATAASPGSPFVVVSKLSDLAEARTTTEESLGTLALGLAGIALLVGGVGIANTMVVTVIERRGEIGLRRALGARRGQIVAQFLGEAIALSSIGGVVGLVLGCIAAFVVAGASAQPLVVPVSTLVAGPVLAVLVGALAGLQPAFKAASLPPTVALRAV